MVRPLGHPGTAYDLRITVYLNNLTLQALDRLRGDTPRSTYLRDLLRDKEQQQQDADSAE